MAVFKWRSLPGSIAAGKSWASTSFRRLGCKWPRRYRVPDIAVMLNKAKGPILREPPFLCIEVLSPEDRVSRMEEKIDDYLKFGVQYVWLIDPRKKSAWPYTRKGAREAVSVLVTENPRSELPILDLFAELDEEIEPEQELFAGRWRAEAIRRKGSRNATDADSM